jgi:nucleotide-binding universal stress UspA family protein
MIANVKSVLVAITKESTDKDSSSAVAYGLSLAQATGAHLTVQAASVKLVLTNAWVSGFAAQLVAAENRRLHGLAEAVARTAHSEASAAGVVCATETPHLPYQDLLASLGSQARVHDLSIVDSEPSALALDRGLVETLLMDSGHPLVVVPHGTSRFASRRVIVAWDGSGRAARAVAGALPFLRAAEAVEVVSVTGEKELPDSLMGAELAPHLARHGVPVTVKILAAVKGDVAETLRAEATLFGADMIVMGAFVHSRLRELVFGGVTNELLKDSPVPLFMAH